MKTRIHIIRVLLIFLTLQTPILAKAVPWWEDSGEGVTVQVRNFSVLHIFCDLLFPYQADFYEPQGHCYDRNCIQMIDLETPY